MFAKRASKNVDKCFKPSVSDIAMELQCLNNDFLDIFEMSSPALSKAARISPAHRRRRTYICGEASLKTILDSLYQQLSTSRPNGTNPGPSKPYSGMDATNFRVMLARCTHCGAKMHTSCGRMPTDS